MKRKPKLTFSAVCRENTGAHMLDSGGAYGRHWERGPIPNAAPVVTWDENSGPTIHTGPWLDAVMTIDRKIQARFERWAKRPENTDLDWFEAGERFAVDVLGLVQRAKDNTYNNECDLDQVFVWEVYTKDADSDWYYANDAESVVVIHTHNGCDVRGGYSRPIFCHSRIDDAVIPSDFVAGLVVVDAHDPDGNPCDRNDVPEADRLSIGWSGNPFCQFEREAKRIFWHTLNQQAATCCALLNSGYRVKLAAYAPEVY